MALFSKIFGNGGKQENSAVTYKDLAIIAVPQKEHNGWRIAARIEKNGKVHMLIRADVLQAKDEADAVSVTKAKQMIDEQGDRLFD